MLVTLVLSALGAALGAWGGAQYVIHRMHRPTPLHEMLHEELHMTREQQARIAGLEREHAARRRALESEMRAANADLARAFQEQHAYTPQVQAAIDRFHRAMSDLQRETILHVLAMRRVLTAEQAERFDESVVTSLTSDPM
jgi:Spy/CpxP family protein refolding chaperone